MASSMKPINKSWRIMEGEIALLLFT